MSEIEYTIRYEEVERDRGRLPAVKRALLRISDRLIPRYNLHGLPQLDIHRPGMRDSLMFLRDLLGGEPVQQAILGAGHESLVLKGGTNLPAHLIEGNRYPWESSSEIALKLFWNSKIGVDLAWSSSDAFCSINNVNFAKEARDTIRNIQVGKRSQLAQPYDVIAQFLDFTEKFPEYAYPYPQAAVRIDEELVGYLVPIYNGQFYRFNELPNQRKEELKKYIPSRYLDIHGKNYIVVNGEVKVTDIRPPY